MSGVMVELGVYAVARVYRVVFAASIPHAVLTHAFLALGLLTAAVGSVMCLGQRHLKRLLAYSTIAHVGLFLIAVGLGDADAIAGAALYVAGHAGIKGALFLVAGLLLNRFRSVDEDDLYGRGGGRRDLSGWIFLIAAVALAGLPPFGPGLGKAVAEDAASVAGYPWLAAVFVLVSAVTGGAVLRAGLRIFHGIGQRPRTDPQETSGSGEQQETERPIPRAPAAMLAAMVLLLAGGAAVGMVPPLAAAVSRGAELFVDRDGYLAQALTGAPGHTPAASPAVAWTLPGVVLGLLSTGLAAGIAGAALYGRRAGALRVPAALRRAHSGHVGDYVAWLFTGAALLAALVGLPLL
jgi:multicomponent Na+:H+ antiporter subunit D